MRFEDYTNWRFLLSGLVVIMVVWYCTNKLNWGQKAHPGFVVNIEDSTVENKNYRQVLYTTNNMQLVLMSLKPGEEIGMEVHPKTSQFFRVEEGTAVAQIGEEEFHLSAGDAMVVPPGTQHNVTNSSSYAPLQLYTIYTPPQHKPGTIQKDKPAND